MKIEKLYKYIQNERSKGQTDDIISQKLQYVGWDKKIILKHLIDEDIPRPDTSKKGKASLWDAFEHILLFISLYVFSITFGLLLHFFVNRYLPGVDEDFYRYGEQARQTEEVNGYIAGVLVSFPVFLFLFRKITQRTLSDPSLRSEIARKLLTYATLIGTFIILLYQASRTIFSLLQGNITWNFVLHFLITSSISTIFFAYYYNEVQEDRKALN